MALVSPAQTELLDPDLTTVRVHPPIGLQNGTNTHNY